MNEPLFSIVIPVYNSQGFVGRAIESVLDQTRGDWELVLVDDCSTDRTPIVLDEYKRRDDRIRVLRNPENLNIAKSLNRGIRNARGKWIVRLDADDYFNDYYLETLVRYAEKHGCGNCFFSSWITAVDEKGGKIVDVRLPGAEKIRKMMKIENFLYHPATSFPKELWEKAGGYPVNDRTIAEDTALWIKFFEMGAELILIPEFLMNYCIHYSNITSVNDAGLNKENADWKRVRQNREWRASLYLKQKQLKMAREEILTLGRAQKHFSLKNLQYMLLTFLPESFVYFFMWEFRPRVRAFLKNLRGRSVRI